MAGELKARETRLDILVNNAGATWGAPLEDFPEVGWDRVMEFALNDPATRERIEQSIPLGRVGGAEDIAGVALFLCDRAAAYISGAIIPLDGGAAAAR